MIQRLNIHTYIHTYIQGVDEQYTTGSPRLKMVWTQKGQEHAHLLFLVQRNNRLGKTLHPLLHYNGSMDTALTKKDGTDKNRSHYPYVYVDELKGHHLALLSLSHTCAL